ncbi:hypothetical protein DX914_13460 [Lysobacter silvisoli]|uniref:Uncharacterized protein n=1 Tax=Lysobacter silvisoli TaxID=2293254 RepID=A0A371K062_9GAMM|nr:hypothetical protein DX914_13460 [Lysobacter silvisoli]
MAGDGLEWELAIAELDTESAACESTNEAVSLVADADADADAVAADQLYLATWSTSRYLPGNLNGSCSAVSPQARMAFRLTVKNARYGHLQITVDTWDALGNYPGTSTVVLASEVALQPGTAIVLTAPGSRAMARFRGARVSGGSGTMTVEVSAPWTARRDGRVCHSGTNSFNRTIALTRAALHALQEGEARFAAD